MLGERIKEFRPAPIVAMTATATPLVQDDICTQLGLQKEVRFIEGFRRENLGVHILEADPKTRPETILNILNEPKNLPAIIYAPTRKKAEELCEFFSDDFKISYYHAGMTAEDRSKVQSEYLTGKTDIIVATIAFGMGIDKPNVRTVIHAGLPGSIESYYQEIGRAGRDGKESNAFLLYTYADQKTHEYFFKMSYPEVAEIKKIHNILTKKFQTKDELFSQLKKMNSNTFLKGLEQLKVHQGALINFNEEVAIGKSSWTKTYQVQLRHKENELLKILEFVKTNKCRMHLLVSHFGEKSNANHKCGKCDICNPTLKKNFEVNFELTDADEKLALKIVQVVKEEQPLAAGKLFLFLSKNRPKLKRGHFEKIVSELSNRGKLKVQEEVFEKDGKIIEYRKISLGAKVSQNWW